MARRKKTLPTRREPRKLKFKVSTGLKRVLGRELITDEEVAIFELVKNSFDAAAERVDIHFSSGSIWVIDDGTGMTYEDLTQKWLFVAYSAKRQTSDYRDVVANRRHYAGSKGIGRFSSDRLGHEVLLQTRHKTEESGIVHQVQIDWDRFEKDDLKQFATIPVEYSQEQSFSLPKEVPLLKSGTAIEIRGTRGRWERTEISSLKRALAKLINPFGADVDGFQIYLHAPEEVENDDNQLLKAESKGQPPLPKDVVNGPVGNFIFSALQDKTTFIKMRLTDDGDAIETCLVDRGEIIYRIRESNPYHRLRKSEFKCELYYLNRAAKYTFARRVGLPSVQFGSVFLFRNGFRVYPIGEDGDDWFGIGRRKQQGYARFLGTREVIGRIDVEGDDRDFQEASSRNQGLIETSAVRELKKCYWEHCHKRLERYVVPVSWADQAEKDSGDLSRLLTDPGKVRVSTALAALVDNDEIELLEYSQKLTALVSERSDHFEQSLTSLRLIAEKTNDRDMLVNLKKAESRFEELRKAEAEAYRRAKEEIEAREKAEKRAEVAEKAAKAAVDEYEEEKKRNLFLRSVSALDYETILNMHHQIIIYTNDLEIQIENIIAGLEQQEAMNREALLAALEPVSLLNKKIKTVSKFATKANFRLESEEIETDMADYIYDYVDGIAKDFSPPGLSIFVENVHPGFFRYFKPIDISIVVDNFISNAQKAQASTLHFEVLQPKGRKGILELRVKDNGRGVSSRIESDRLFEKGFTTTDGAGLGLYHVRQVLGEMGGSVRLDRDGEGTIFIVEVTVQ